MSAFAGMLSFDRRPIDREWLKQFGAGLSHRGPDGGHEIVSGPAALAARMFHTTPESRLEQQPTRDRHGVWLCWDGRLDNAYRLAALCGLTFASQPDPALVLATYHQDRRNFLSHIVGDFALALWDGARHQLILARDCAGTRTLYFHCDPERLVWSTDLEALIRFGGIEPSVDEEYVAGYLAYETDSALTPFRTVNAVRPAEAVIFSTNGRCERRRFWELNLSREISYRRDEDYADAFKALFRDAVRARLRTDRPVVAELSGGLDSSSIVAIADDVLAGGETSAPNIETVSQVFDAASSSDERRFIREIEVKRRHDGKHFSEDEWPLFDALEGSADDLHLNPYGFASAYHAGVDAWMRSIDARVLLSGVGGDEIAGGGQNPTADLANLLVTGQLTHLVRRASMWSATLRTPLIKTLWLYAIRPVLPVYVRRGMRARQASSELTVYRAEYIERAGLRERLGAGLEPVVGGRPGSRDQAAGFVTVVAQIASGCRREMSSADVTYPFLHRPLVEFMQSIPADRRTEPGRNRLLQRHALTGLLPEQILRRRSKGNPMECFARAFARSHESLNRLLRDGFVVQRGYVDPDRLAVELDRSRHGQSKAVIPLLRIVALERWFRALDSRAHALRPGPKEAWTSAAGASGALRSGNSAARERDVTCSTA